MAVKKLQELALNCGLSKKLDGLMEAMVASLGLNYQTLIDADLFGVCDPLLLKPEKPPPPPPGEHTPPGTILHL
jgi:hypothetical protein